MEYSSVLCESCSHDSVCRYRLDYEEAHKAFLDVIAEKNRNFSFILDCSDYLKKEPIIRSNNDPFDPTNYLKRGV